MSHQSRDAIKAELIEQFRKALMVEHARDWTMDTISEAAHICAREITPVLAGLGSKVDRLPLSVRETLRIARDATTSAPAQRMIDEAERWIRAGSYVPDLAEPARPAASDDAPAVPHSTAGADSPDGQP